MGYRNLRECVDELAATRQLVRVDDEVDANLEAAEIHRRVNQAGGPAVLFTRVKGCAFPMVCNLFGTLERARYIFRDSLDNVRRLIEMKIDPRAVLRQPSQWLGATRTALTLLPKRVRSGPVLDHETTIDRLPQLKCWPEDGGAFITLPLVYTEDADHSGWRHSNLGMYRVQLSGGQYRPNEEVGLHYQIHRGIGVHHAAAVRRKEPLKANIFVGGAPAMMLAAVMPLPEGMPEIAFAGALGRRRVPLIESKSTARQLPIYAEADFCICGTVNPRRTLPEGPFGDHLGYYSLAHEFPVLCVKRVYHRTGAIWPFTVVGRPPQEDTVFGQLIHELTGPIIPTVIAGVRAVHAVDASGVHPLLLAIGSERYTPYSKPDRPQELLTQANAILGQGQLSLAKYLLIVNGGDDEQLDVHNVAAFFAHLLRRVDWRRDLHFQTCTTIDTLDYSGERLNEGSKVVIAAAGPVQRELPTELPGDLRLPNGFRNPHICLAGVLAVEGPKYSAATGENDSSVAQFCSALACEDAINQFPLIVIVDDSQFTAASLANFLWVTFTRSNPAADLDGIGSFVEHKHWGCAGALVIDARLKPHHAPPLLPDLEVSRRVDKFFAAGGPLHGIG
ncbi:MAG TPA: UbiD family decarboxylase [Pirellulales bacterium]|jgi:4-hydroxy-3-polyprenylbenzoate decarboxylase|nr:UbiD family decarboxylase [Pirellulales bacterium]